MRHAVHTLQAHWGSVAPLACLRLNRQATVNRRQVGLIVAVRLAESQVIARTPHTAPCPLVPDHLAAAL